MEITNSLYKKYEKMVNAQVWKVHRSCPMLDIDDLRGEANLIFCMAASSFDESKGTKFSTHLTWKLKSLFAEPDKIRAPKSFANDTENFWHNLELETQIKNDSAIQMNYKAQTACHDYDCKMMDCDSGESWEVSIPNFVSYFNSLSDKAKEMFNDILDGNLDPSASVKKALGDGKRWQQECANLDTHKMWLRLYKKKGWSLPITSIVRNELMKTIKQWQRGELPTKCTSKNDFQVADLF